MAQQHEDGYRVAPTETNSTIEAEWLLACHILGVELPIEAGVIRALLQRQRADGSWEIYPGAPAGDINSTVEVYAALRARGMAADSPELVRARDWILAHGGLGDVRVFTRYWLALIGVWPWRATPDLPPELISFPLWFAFNIHNFALLAVDEPAYTPAIEAGVQYLAQTQTADGTCDEHVYTATGFPGYGVGQAIPLDDPELHDKLSQGPELSRGFMISFNMYRHYFPMLALARARAHRGE